MLPEPNMALNLEVADMINSKKANACVLGLKEGLQSRLMFRLRPRSAGRVYDTARDHAQAERSSSGGP